MIASPVVGVSCSSQGMPSGGEVPPVEVDGGLHQLGELVDRHPALTPRAGPGDQRDQAGRPPPQGAQYAEQPPRRLPHGEPGDD
ncbi:hypothetical protein ACFQ71_28120 [Streptomyces sp. NPDC056534]|uniref:hypothetical protein n=1 Tax=Streptomyces sp. NPDC056534 TaxID=3345857 RepID=UPI0036950DCB